MQWNKLQSLVLGVCCRFFFYCTQSYLMTILNLNFANIFFFHHSLAFHLKSNIRKRASFFFHMCSAQCQKTSRIVQYYLLNGFAYLFTHMEQINENFEMTLLHSKFHQRLHSHINSIFEHFYVFTLRLVKQKGELDLNTLNMNDHGMFGRTSTDTHTHALKTTIPAFFVVYFFL